MDSPMNDGSTGSIGPSRLSRIAPALSLLALAPVVAEVLSGATRVSFIVVLIPEIMVWGCGALLIREIVLRWRGGWTSMLLLGLALSVPRRKIVVLDGDGALLMKLGALASVATHAPANLLHVVFNDGVYASTGGQANAAGLVSLARLAHAAGYATSAQVETAVDLQGALGVAGRAAGPHMISVATTFEPRTEAPRVDEPPATHAQRLRALRLCEQQAAP